MRRGSEEGSYLRLIDLASLNSRIESNKEEENYYPQVGHYYPAAAPPVGSRDRAAATNARETLRVAM
jgi:hypothetical protein